MYSPYATRLSIIIGNLLLIFCCCYLLNPAFDTSDDTHLMMISSGYINGHPSEWLIYIPVFTGKLLKTLYSHCATINWYTFMLYTAQLTYCSIWLITLIGRFGKRVGLVFYFLLFIFIEIPLLQQLQYTSTAFVLGISGVWLLSHFLQQGRANKLDLLLAVIAMLGSCCIRFSAFEGALAVGLPLLTYLYYRKPLHVVAYAAIIILLGATSVYSYEYFAYKQATGGTRFTEYQQQASNYMNNPISVTPQALQQSGFTTNDIQLLGHWFWLDPSVYTQEKIINLAKASANHRPINKDLVYKTIDTIEREAIYLILLAVFLILVIIIREKKAHPLYITILSTGVILLLLTIFARTPHRVVLPLIVFTLLMAIYSLPTDIWQLLKQRIAFLISFILLIAIGIAYQTRISINHINENNLSQRRFNNFMQFLMQQPPLPIITVIDHRIPYEGISLWNNPALSLHPVLIPTGWFTNTPAYKELLQHLAIKDLTLNSIANKNVLFCGGETGFSNTLQVFAQEHYHTTLQFDTLSRFENNFPIYKLRTTVHYTNKRQLQTE